MDDKKQNPKGAGELTEAMCLAAFVRGGEKVLLPFGDNQRYDMVLHRGEDFIRVQCKTGRLRNGAVEAATCSSYAHRGNGSKDYTGSADWFAVWCPDTDKVYVVPVDEAPKRQITLRVEEPKCPSSKRMRWAKEYEYCSPVA